MPMTVPHTAGPPPALVALPSVAPPRIDRSDVGVVIVAHWHVTPATQERVADAIIDAWTRITWPDGLLAVTTLVSLDGDDVLQYAQWTSDRARQQFAALHEGGTPSDAGHAAVPSQPPVSYRLYRSGVRDPAPTPGCIVVVTVEFDAPDEARQRAWIDLVFEALAAETEPAAGGISGHFHVSLDGVRVLNYAEWVDEASHRAAIDASGQGAVGRNPRWRAVQQYPGVRASGVTRYRLHRRLAPEPAPSGDH